MTRETSSGKKPSQTAENDPLSQEVQSLTFALLDEQADEAQRKRLEELLTSDAQAREVYLSCVQMHVDLQHFFGGEKQIEIPTDAADAKQDKGTLPLGLPISLPPMPGISTPLDQG